MTRVLHGHERPVAGLLCEAGHDRPLLAVIGANGAKHGQQVPPHSGPHGAEQCRELLWRMGIVHDDLERLSTVNPLIAPGDVQWGSKRLYSLAQVAGRFNGMDRTCLLYTSDAADDLLCVDLGGRRIINK